MGKPKTFAEKQAIRYNMIYLAFGTLIAIPLLALLLLVIGIDPAPASAIFSTAAITLGGIVVGFFATAIKDDKKDDDV